MTATPVMAIHDLVRSFPKPEGDGTFDGLGPVDLAVAEGEFVAIVGPSGCGKSTLLHIMAGLDCATRGEVRFRETPVTDPGPHLGVVFQHYTCLPWMSVLDNLALGLKWRGTNRTQRHQQAQKYVDLVGLSGFEHAYPVTLSGGMQQRVAIARSLAAEPQVLFMDEPFGALDAQTRSTLQVELLRIFRETGRATVFVTHDIDEAVFLADRVVVLTPRPGRIQSIVEIDFPRPRSLAIRATEQFAALRTQVANGLEQGTAEALQDR